MLCDEARTDLRLAAWGCRRRLHQHLDLTAIGHPEHAEAEAATEIAIARVGLASLAAHRHLRGNPDLVAGRCTIDRLKDQLEIEGQLELADHDYRRIAHAEAHEIAPADPPPPGGSRRRRPASSRPPISPLTVKPSSSRKRLTGR